MTNTLMLLISNHRHEWVPCGRVLANTDYVTLLLHASSNYASNQATNTQNPRKSNA